MATLHPRDGAPIPPESVVPPEAMHRIPAHKATTGIRPRRPTASAHAQSPSLVMLVLIATIGILAYSSFLLNPASRGDWLPYSLVILAESILIFQALLSMWTILSGSGDPREFNFHQARASLVHTRSVAKDGLADRPERWPLHLGDQPASVDVFVTTYGEDIDVIRTTVTAVRAMQGEHLTWVLDDGRSDDVRDLAAELGGRYLRRLSSNGAKAGNVNRALTMSTAEYFVIFDADFVPKREFLIETLPFFIDDKVAFVQTPQAYSNLHNVISRGAGYMQAVFYRFIQPGRNRFNAAFCVGTNVIFRRDSINDVGGMYTDSKSEDSGRRSNCTSGAGRPSTSPRCWRPGMHQTPWRRTPSSSCAGLPAASRSCFRATR
ncbi:glycosyltransferase [Cryobacterium sp. M23]|uniref:glycosyltransferase n=1 Tax=Cryobacterium sp. M23 TaxID=2048292 RepID=UPI001E344B7B|nr:glycosyltransferase [Cryobacterium sp. M23]